MGTTRRFRGDQGLIALLTAGAMCTGIWMIGHGAEAQAPPPQPSADQGFAGPGAARPSAAPAPPPPPMPASRPLRVRIPSLGVNAPLTGLGLDENGSLATPPEGDRNLAGWYENGTTPGSTGTSLIAGHVDTRSGPAVFYNLGALKKNHTIEVVRADGRTAVFSIDAVEVYDGNDFPDKKVYGPADRPELRLITCGGGFNKARQEYLGNVVAFAHLTATKREPGKREPVPRSDDDSGNHRGSG
ncbi:peptidase C60 sortase A and B [Streptomyces griseoflavus]|uniref:class F sortase n=1 Tax=Streptomyces rimosus TaxID=1927 RepID=UPI0004C73A3D|nr:class F sortase [Streptomyces rimosus]KOG66787.1 peptidase C60 sortase A and B [Streptomyces griseoflavus]